MYYIIFAEHYATAYYHPYMWPDLGKPSVWDLFWKSSWVWCTVDKLYHRANSCSSPRPIVHFTEELQCFVCDCVTPPIIEKLRSKGVAMHTYGVSVYDAYTGSQLNGPGWSCSKWMQRSSESRISPSISRATTSLMPKKLSERTVVRWI